VKQKFIKSNSIQTSPKGILASPRSYSAVLKGDLALPNSVLHPLNCYSALPNRNSAAPNRNSAPPNRNSAAQNRNSAAQNCFSADAKLISAALFIIY
jgi:hypothetical protein